MHRRMCKRERENHARVVPYEEKEISVKLGRKDKVTTSAEMEGRYLLRDAIAIKTDK